MTEPVVEVAIGPNSEADRARFERALAELAALDTTFHVSIDPESRQAIIAGVDEHHLDAKVQALRQVFKIDVKFGAPQVAYRETQTTRVEKDYTYKKIGQFARVKIIFEPNEAGAGSAFESKIVGGAVPKEYILGVEKGINSVMRSGVLAGFPVVDVKVTLIDGAFHDVDSSVLAFEIASRAAFREALKDGCSVLLEPIMEVEVTIPEDYTGFVISDLLARRGQMQGQDMHGNLVVINAMVPLANMFGYVNQLLSGTQGRGTFTMRFAWYEAAPHPDGKNPPPAAAAAMQA